MKDQGIDKGLFKEIDTDKPQFRGIQSIRKLFWKYLNLLGVPFNDPCCPEASTTLASTTSTTTAAPSFSFREYTALLSQSGTDAPTATVLNSTAPNYLGDIVWTRDSIGLYIGTLTGELDQNRMLLLITNNNIGHQYALGVNTSPDSVFVEHSSGGVDLDTLDHIGIVIKVYP